MNDGTGEKSSNEDDVGREAIGQLLLSLVAYATVKTTQSKRSSGVSCSAEPFVSYVVCVPGF